MPGLDSQVTKSLAVDGTPGLLPSAGVNLTGIPFAVLPGISSLGFAILNDGLSETNENSSLSLNTFLNGISFVSLAAILNGPY